MQCGGYSSGPTDHDQLRWQLLRDLLVMPLPRVFLSRGRKASISLPRLCALRKAVTKHTGGGLLLLVLDCRMVLSHACIGWCASKGPSDSPMSVRMDFVPDFALKLDIPPNAVTIYIVAAFRGAFAEHNNR